MSIGVDADFNIQYIVDNYSILKSRQGSANRSIGSFLLESKVRHKDHNVTVSFLGTHSNGSPSDLLGDLQVLSNIDVQGEEGFKLYELFYQFIFRKLEVGFGWVDLSNSYNLNTSGALLVHSSFGTNAGFGNAGLYGPSIYPIPFFGLNLKYSLEGKYYIQMALTDVGTVGGFKSKKIQYDLGLSADNHLGVLEFGRKTNKGVSVGFGLWNLVADDTFLGEEIDQVGVFFQGEYLKFIRFSPFIRGGVSSKRIDRVYANVSVGARSLPWEKKYGVFEFGFNRALIWGVAQTEEVFETLYSLSVTDWLKTSLSYQNINNIGGRRDQADVLTVRFNLQESFLFHDN